MYTRNSCRISVAVIAASILIVLGVTPASADDPNAPPVITQHPASRTVCDGVNVTFTVVASGENLSYQWRKDDEPLYGATSDTLTLDVVSPADNGDYDVVVTNPYGQDTSDAAALLVDAGPEITEHPAGEEVCEGAGVTLSVSIANQATAYEDPVGSTSSSGSGARMRGNYYRVDAATTLTRIEQYLSISTSGMLVFFVYEADNLSGPYTLIAEDTVTDSGTGTGYYSSSGLAVPLQLDKYYIIGAAWPDAHTYYWDYSHPHATTFGISLNGFAYSYQDPLPTTPPANSNSSAYMQRLTTSDLALTCQWRKDDQDIAGASGTEYVIDQMSSADAGDYDVVITNDCGQVVSDTATLTLGPGVIVTHDPNDHSVCAGEAAVFSIQAEGSNLSYQWRKDGVDIVDATSDTYTISSADPNDTGAYDVVVSNDCATLTSAPATLTVADGPPTLNRQPATPLADPASGTFADYRPAYGRLAHAMVSPGFGGEEQFVCEGDPVSLTVAAEGVGLQYQWRKDGVDILGATGESYVLGAADPNDSGEYAVFVSNPCGSLTAEIALLTVDTAVSITEQPAGDLICEGQPYALAVVAAGSNLSYQWRKDGEDISGANADTFFIEAAALEDTGDYDVVITNGCGVVVSDTAELTVVAGPVIAEQPADQVLAVGEPLTLAVGLDPNSFPADSDTIGLADTLSTGARVRGNSYQVTGSRMLTRIGQYLDVSESGLIVFFVYEADSEQGSYTLILEDTVVNSGTGLGFYESNPIDVTLEAGKYYIIGAAWPGPHTYYWGGAHPQVTAFGQSVHGYAASYQSQLPLNPVPSSSNVYYQHLTTADAAASYQWRKDEVEIPGATSETYSVAAVTPADAGSYDVLVSNECGSVVSDVAIVALTPAVTPESWMPTDPNEFLETPQPETRDP